MNDSHALIDRNLQRLAGQSATCKVWSCLLAAVALLFAAGRAEGIQFLWVGAPVLILALADACYAGQAIQMAQLGQRLSNSTQGSAQMADYYRTQLQGCESSGIVGGLTGLLSCSVWPFYAALAGLVIGLGMTVMVPRQKAPPVAPAAENVPLRPSPATAPTGAPDVNAFPKYAPRRVPPKPGGAPSNPASSKLVAPPPFPPPSPRPTTAPTNPYPKAPVPSPSAKP